MEKGDKVKFVGDKNGYLVSYQPYLKRIGEIVKIEERGIYAGKAFVRWLPKTSRGLPQSAYHKLEELQII